MSAQEIKYDVDGFENITNALMDLLNRYPALNGEEITFSVLAEDGGRAMFPVSGAVIMTESRDILGTVRQVCTYPFFVRYRASGLSESRKIAVKEWLDNLGKWLEKQPITVNGAEYQLNDYPALTGTRQFIELSRQTPAYLEDTGDNKAEDWAIYISAQYKNEFNMR